MPGRTGCLQFIKQSVHAVKNGLLHGVLSSAYFQRMQISNPSGSGKDIAERNGVHYEAESEGSRKIGLKKFKEIKKLLAKVTKS